MDLDQGQQEPQNTDVAMADVPMTVPVQEIGQVDIDVEEAGTIPVPAPVPVNEEHEHPLATSHEDHAHAAMQHPHELVTAPEEHQVQVQVPVPEPEPVQESNPMEAVTVETVTMTVESLQAQLQSFKESNAALVNQVNSLLAENEAYKHPQLVHGHGHALPNLHNHSAADNQDATATAAAAAQLTTYQNALALSESQKQELVNENQILRQRLVQAGIQISDVISPVHNHDVNVGVPVPLPVPTSMVGDQERKIDGDAVIDITEAEALAAIDPQQHQHVHSTLNHAHIQHGHAHAHAVHHEVNTPHSVSVSVSVPMTPNTAGLSSRSEEKWEMHFARLTQYKNEHGNCLVPTSTELGRWLCRQRHNYRYKNLKEERKQRLMELDKTCLGERIAELGGVSSATLAAAAAAGEAGANGAMPSIPGEGGVGSLHPAATHALNTKTKYNQAYESKLHAKWDKFYQQLLSYKEEHGHCNFPTMNGSLGRWISRQRTLYRSQKLKADRYEKLLSVGFAFEDATALEFKGKLDQQWEAMFQNLLEHKEQKGHCFDVPETLPLGKWLYRQRWLYRHGNLRQDRADKLLAVGFEDKKVLKKHAVNGGNAKKKRKREGDLDVDGDADGDGQSEAIQEGTAPATDGVPLKEEEVLRQAPQEMIVGDEAEAVAAAMAAADEVSAMPAVNNTEQEQPMDHHPASTFEGGADKTEVPAMDAIGDATMDDNEVAKAAVQEIVDGVSV